MIYERRYVQFNDLVIDGYDMISESDSDVSFKYVSHEKTFGNGSYVPFKKDHVFTEEGSVSLTLKLHMKKLPCEQRPLYRQMAMSELVRPGKLWAVQNNELVWAYAVLTNKGEQNSYAADKIVLSVDFRLPEGIWHKADKQKTFLQDYNVCTFMDCYDFKVYDPCKSCCECEEVFDVACNCCICDTICKEMALCYNTDRLQSAYEPCDGGVDFHIVYDCIKGQEFFGDYYLGQKFCTGDSCSGVIAGLVYGITDIPTDSFVLTIHGKMKDPEITINGNTNVLKGEYDGTLTIRPNGEALFSNDDCCEGTLIDVNKWVVPKNMNYGWMIYPGNNRLVINTNMCCTSCAYVDIDGITV